MWLSLFEVEAGCVLDGSSTVVYDVGTATASFGAGSAAGPAIAWCLARDEEALVALSHKVSSAPALAVEVELDPALDWVARCDRVDFPPGGVAYRHVHPGPGIRRLLLGELTIDSPDGVRSYRAGDAWFEGADHPVLATASMTEETAFVRVLLLPAEWAGKRTIRYLDPADEAKPKLQRAAILLEEPIAL